MSNLVQYQPWSPEDAAGQAEEVGKTLGAGTFWKPAAGENVIRFMPARAGAPIVVTYQHMVEVPGQENSVMWNCPRLHKAGYPCPGCLRVDELRVTGNPADYEAAGNFLPKLRAFGAIVDRANEGLGPQVYAFGKTVYEPVMALRNKNPALDVPFTNPDNTGVDIIIMKKGEGMKTKYTPRAAPRCSPLSHDANLMREWLEATPGLAGYARVPTQAELREKLAEIANFMAPASTARPAAAARPAPATSGGYANARSGTAAASAGRGRPRSVADDLDATSGGGYTPHPDD
jgi:hypothetical protein